MRKLGGLVVLLVSMAAPASGIRSANLGSGIRSGGMSRSIDMPTGGALFEFLPASGNGAPVAMDLCDALSSADKVGNWWCIDGGKNVDYGSTNPSFTFTSIDTSSRALCSNGLDCAASDIMYASAASDRFRTATGKTSAGTTLSIGAVLNPMDVTGGMVGFISSAGAGGGWFVLYASAGAVACSVHNGTSATEVTEVAVSQQGGFVFYSCSYNDTGAAGQIRMYINGTQTDENLAAVRPLPTSVQFEEGADVQGNIIPGQSRGFFYSETVLDATAMLRLSNAVHGTLTGSRAETVTFTRASTQFCENGAGAGTTMRSGQPCVAQNGYLSEGAATNLVLRSEELDHASWVDVGTPATSANGQTGVDGTLTGDTLTDNDAAALEGESQSVASTSQTKHTLSCWMKAGTATEATLRMTGTGNSTGDQTCTFTSISSSAWDRKVCTSGTAYGAGITNVLGEVLAGDAVGDTGTLHVWGCQIEAQAFASSYIRTEGSTAARVATRAYASGSLLSTVLAGAGSTCFTYNTDSLAALPVWIDTRTINTGAQPGWSVQSNGTNISTEFVDATGSMYDGAFANATLGAATRYCVQVNGTTGTATHAGSTDSISIARTVPAHSGLAIGQPYYSGQHVNGFIGNVCIDKRPTGCRP